MGHPTGEMPYSSRSREGGPNRKGLAGSAGPFPFRVNPGRCYAGGMTRLAYVDPATFEIPNGWTAVGFLDAGAVLAYDADRLPHRVEDGIATPLDPADVNAGLAPAVEEAASRLWPEGWSYAMAESFGINRRGLQRDRLAKSGLHPAILRELGALSCHDDAEGIGRLAHALVRRPLLRPRPPRRPARRRRAGGAQRPGRSPPGPSRPRDEARRGYRQVRIAR
jgi:hypothetical protein